ncbi:MAG TPA: hypothetical protein PLQ11_07990, partial [Beijerinckiaceae bacterium]|nr:hypothetical protein [Beijerinckiaceae bacterium]
MRLPSGGIVIGLVLGLALALAGCGLGLDSEQIVLCRQVLPVVAPERPATIVAEEAGEAGTVFVRFRTPGLAAEQLLACRFAGSGLGLDRRVLTGVAVNGSSLSASAVFFLRERWLTSQDAVADAPALPRGTVTQLSPGVAYGLQQGLAALPKLGIYALISASYAVIYGLVGRINLAFGGFAALGGSVAVLAMMLIDLLGLPSLSVGMVGGLWIAWMTATLYGLTAARLVIGRLTFRPGQGVLIASVGLSLVLSEGLRLAQGASALWLPPLLAAPIVVAEAPGFVVTLTPMALLTAIMAGGSALAMAVALRRGRFGRDWHAVADDAVAAELFGIDPQEVLVQSFAIAAAMAGLAGALVSLHYGGMGF